MAPLAEPWRPLRGAAAHLWWAYYHAIKKRDGVIGGADKVIKVAKVAKSAKAAKVAKAAK